LYGNTVVIKEVIKEVAAYLNSEKIPDLNLRFYKYKEAISLNLSNFNIKKIEIDKKIIIISIIKFLKNFKLINKETLNKIRKEKINEKIAKIIGENCEFIYCQKKDLIKILDNLIDGLEPEQILISRIYDKGIQIYSFK
jgi:Glu-tRNA(Gln) amidotransferase subunit E-like FAD-binding protein